jgi:hypothetical protein
VFKKKKKKKKFEDLKMVTRGRKEEEGERGNPPHVASCLVVSCPMSLL